MPGGRLLGLLLLLLIAACSRVDSLSDTRERRALQTESTAGDLPYLIRHGLTGADGVPTALGQGVLTEQRQCLWLDWEQAGGTQLLLWPPYATISVAADGTAIVNFDGQDYPVGEFIEVQGGEVTHIEELVIDEVPDQCQANVAWLVAGQRP